MSKRRRTFSLATLLGIVGAFALLFLGIDYFSASSRYQRQQDVENLRYILSTRISTGDTRGHVTSLLGAGTPDDDGSYLKAMLGYQAGKYFDPTTMPDGVRDGDLFVHYGAKPKPAYPLQFRAGKLVNHDPKWYTGPDVTSSGLSN